MQTQGGKSLNASGCTVFKLEQSGVKSHFIISFSYSKGTLVLREEFKWPGLGTRECVNVKCESKMERDKWEKWESLECRRARHEQLVRPQLKMWNGELVGLVGSRSMAAGFLMEQTLVQWCRLIETVWEQQGPGCNMIYSEQVTIARLQPDGVSAD